MCFDAWLPFGGLLYREDGLSGVRVDVESVHDVMKGGWEFLGAYFDSTVDVGGEGVVAWESGETEGSMEAYLVNCKVYG